MRMARLSALLPLMLIAAGPAVADDLIEVKRLSMDIAADIAHGAVEACRKEGYQVTAVVVDRDGFEQMVMRDTLAPRFTLQIARDKANAVILSGVSSAAFRQNRRDIRTEMTHVKGILVLEGGLPIRAAGSLVGAIGVSGAPGGDRDAACAKAGLAAVQERLEFAD